MCRETRSARAMPRYSGSQNCPRTIYFDSSFIENSLSQPPQTAFYQGLARVCLHLSERSVPICRQRPFAGGCVISFVWVLEIVNTPL